MKLKLAGAALLLAASGALAFDPTPAPVSPDGVKAVIDLPTSQHMRNVGGSDGAGLCVFTSLQLGARWQNVRELDGFRTWMERRPGGGWPQKLDQMLAQFAREKGVSVPAYIQHTGGDESFLELALKTDRIVCVTYDGRDDFYRGQIAHMVNLAHLDAKTAAIIDNNRPGVWVWMTRSEFLSRWRGNSGGWAVVLLADPPPPHPETAQLSLERGCVCGAECTCKKGDCPGKCPVVFGQNCANGRCGIPSAPVATPTTSTPATSTPIGSPPSDRHEWRQFDDGAWGWRFKVEPEAKPVAATENHGVDPSKIHAAPTYSLNGVEITKRAAEQALAGADGLRDDSDRWHLTIVGDAAFQVRARADVAMLPADVRGKLLVQAYSPDAWPVALYKLPAGVSLRKPSPARTAADVGAVAPESYTAAKLGELLSLPGGPVARPVPPMPAPAPPGPVVPPEPKPEPKPEPTPQPQPKPEPQPQPTNPLVWILAALAAIWILKRKA